MGAFRETIIYTVVHLTAPEGCEIYANIERILYIYVCVCMCRETLYVLSMCKYMI